MTISVEYLSYAIDFELFFALFLNSHTSREDNVDLTVT